MGILTPDQVAKIRKRGPLPAEDVMDERHRVQADRTKLNLERKELRADQKKFEEMVARFRAVHNSAWDTIVAYKKSPQTVWVRIAELERALHKADHLWEGYAGCARDPAPRDETKNSA